MGILILFILYIIPMLVLFATAYKLADTYPPDDPFYGNHTIVCVLAFSFIPIANLIFSFICVLHYLLNKIRK